ncbi:MAG: hypothetical protein JEZ09_18710 [Salinivirgaceae bacterium]|nr:hypothetical protein [Salinivirgaceae bacterium]
MNRFTLSTILIIFLYFPMFSQVSNEGAKTGEVVTEYDRNAITAIILENKTQYNNDLKSAAANIKIPSKFDDNMVDTRCFFSSVNQSSITNTLINKGIPNEILSKWFSRKESGEFDMSIIHDRGMYNATDDEVKRASGSKIGLAKLKDAGEVLINHSYIMVLNFKDIQTVEEKYKRQDAAKKALAEKLGSDYEPVKRRKNGWEGEAECYVFKLNFNDSIINYFYNDLWIYDDDSEEVKAQKKAMFDQAKFPIQFVLKVDGKADGSQYNAGEILAPPKQLTRNELFHKMINTGIEACFFEVERKIDAFQVKTPLYGTHPLKAKVGKKEGLITENRYFVLEIEQNRKGEEVAKRKGVVRAKKVIDNRKVATGSSDQFTTFYQTAGRRLMDGMLLQQKNDFGIGVSGGYTVSGVMGGGYLKVEANVGAIAGKAIDLGMTQIKLFGTAAFDGGDYTLSNFSLSPTAYEMSFTRLQVGLSKGFYFARNFSIAPFISYGMETASNDDLMQNIVDGMYITDLSETDDQNIGTDFLCFGAFASVNVLHNVQLMAGLNMYAIFGNAYDKDRKELINSTTGEGFKYTKVFTDRKGASVDVGIRIEF